MFQRSPLPIRQGSTVPSIASEEAISTSSINLRSYPDQTSLINTYEPQIYPSCNQTDLLYYRKDINQNIKFLIICIVLLLILLVLGGFLGYWVIIRSNKSNKHREKFLTNFLYGFGILTAIVIFFLFYLIIR